MYSNILEITHQEALQCTEPGMVAPTIEAALGRRPLHLQKAETPVFADDEGMGRRASGNKLEIDTRSYLLMAKDRETLLKAFVFVGNMPILSRKGDIMVIQGRYSADLSWKLLGRARKGFFFRLSALKGTIVSLKKQPQWISTRETRVATARARLKDRGYYVVLCGRTIFPPGVGYPPTVTRTHSPMMACSRMASLLNNDEEVEYKKSSFHRHHLDEVTFEKLFQWIQNRKSKQAVEEFLQDDTMASLKQGRLLANREGLEQRQRELQQDEERRQRQNQN
jgi:hypothetical protein